MERPSELLEHQGLALPGGFSFGDELGSGQILAMKLRHGLSQELARFTQEHRPIIGICNGMQVLVKLGLLPRGQLKQEEATMASNAGGSFQDRWVRVEVDPTSVCHWTRWRLEDFSRWSREGRLQLPIRHGEGRVLPRSPELPETWASQGLVALRYLEDVNGSAGRIAGLTDPSGTVLGLMPHPEAATRMALWPVREERSADPQAWGPGALFFQSIAHYLQQT